MVTRDIQRIVDGLSERLGRPTAVDDPRFRLQVYSPQTGPLDDVRIKSILFRDSPEQAKRWVLSHGIAEADAPVRLPAADHLGLLPRVCVPIWHEGRLLGYLWVIDADHSMTCEEISSCVRVAEELAPLLFRSRALDLLDRETERHELARLIGDDADAREAAAASLQANGVLSIGVRPVAVVAVVATAEAAGLTDAEAVALEAGIERTRSLVSEDHVAQFRNGDEAVLFLGVDDREVVRQGIVSVARRVQGALANELAGHRLVVGVGREQARLSDAVVTYRQALDTARLLARMPWLGEVVRVDELGVYRPLLYVPEDVLLATIPEPLAEFMREGDHQDLARSLEVFLDHAGDASRTAKALQLHRSSVYKRLRRSSEVLGLELDSGEHRREAHYAFAVGRFLGLWPPSA